MFGQGDVTVLGRNGEVIKRIKTDGPSCTNLAFKGKRIYVTELTTGTVQVFDVATEGLPLWQSHGERGPQATRAQTNPIIRPRHRDAEPARDAQRDTSKF